MKSNKTFIVLIVTFLVMIVGCSNGIKNEGNNIIIEKRVDEVDKYEYYNEIKDNKEVQKVKDILDSIRWQNAQVSMAYPPHYKFYFEDTSSKAVGAVYELWISPNIDKVELVIDGESKYVQLNEKMSAELFKKITGNELKDF